MDGRKPGTENIDGNADNYGQMEVSIEIRLLSWSFLSVGRTFSLLAGGAVVTRGDDHCW